MRRSKAQIMEGIDYKSAKIIDSNTVEYIKPDGVKVIRLHRTDILTFPKRGGVILNSDGWKTVTTKERMNSYQGECVIVQDKGVWYITTSLDPYQSKNSRIPYFDGIKIKNGTVINPRKSAHRKEQSLLRQIKAYCTKIKDMDELPMPDHGDCYYCLFQTADGIPMGDSFQDKEHLLSHLKEKYVMGSLLLNALQWAGYNVNGPFPYRDAVIRAVSKYFKSKLGLVC
jgi:hypothetical protein